MFCKAVNLIFSSKNSHHLLNVRPPGDVMLEAIRQIIIDKNITKVVILHDDSIGMHLTLF